MPAGSELRELAIVHREIAFRGSRKSATVLAGVRLGRGPAALWVVLRPDSGSSLRGPCRVTAHGPYARLNRNRHSLPQSI